MTAREKSADAFRAVIADPESDDARRSFMDACTAEGDTARAEFVRWQVVAKIVARAGLDWWIAERNADEFLRGNEVAWAGAIHGRVPWYGFFGGFVEGIQIDASTFLATAPELFSIAPIRRLILKGVAPVAEELFRSPYLSRIVHLVMSVEQLADRHMAMLASSPHLERLAWLDVSGNDIGIPGVEALAVTSTLPSLIQVDFHSNPASIVEEVVWDDQGEIIGAFGAEAGAEIERKYGRKPWLHTVKDHALRRLTETEL